MSDVELVPVSNTELLCDVLTRIVNASVPTVKDGNVAMVVLPRVLIEQAVLVLTSIGEGG